MADEIISKIPPLEGMISHVPNRGSLEPEVTVSENIVTIKNPLVKADDSDGS